MYQGTQNSYTSLGGEIVIWALEVVLTESSTDRITGKEGHRIDKIYGYTVSSSEQGIAIFMSHMIRVSQCTPASQIGIR
jgi:hypothetical protein